MAGKVPGLMTSCSAVPGGATTPGCSPGPGSADRAGLPGLAARSVRAAEANLTPAAQLLSNAPTLTVFDPNLKTTDGA